MRPREAESSPSPSPPPRPAGNLSSMVVRPSDATGGGGGYNSDDFDRRFDSSNPGSNPRRRDFRQESPVGFRRRSSPPPPAYRPYNSGYVPRAGSISPPLRHPRLNGSNRFDTEYSPPRFNHGFRGGRGRGRFRNMSPPRFSSGFGRGSGGRSLGRGYDVYQRDSSPLEEDEYVHRNDPNLSPREGDWICGNPRCGNLNFARRTHCNNCDQPRSAPGRSGPPLIRSPLRRGSYYATSPTARRSPQDLAGSGAPPLNRPIRRNFDTYSSPRSPITTGDDRRGRFQQQDHMQKRRDYDDSAGYSYNSRGRSDNWPLDDDWETVPVKRGYNRRDLSPLPRDRWARERSRSPPPKMKGVSSYMGRGRGDRHYDSSTYMGRGGGGRGFRRTEDSYVGRGRGGAHRGAARGVRNQADY